MVLLSPLITYCQGIRFPLLTYPLAFYSQDRRLAMTPSFLTYPDAHTRRGFFYLGKFEGDQAKAIHLTSARFNSPTALMVIGELARIAARQTSGILVGWVLRAKSPLFALKSSPFLVYYLPMVIISLHKTKGINTTTHYYLHEKDNKMYALRIYLGNSIEKEICELPRLPSENNKYSLQTGGQE